MSGIGNTIRDLREARGLSIRGLSGMCGLPDRRLALIEAGKKEPTWGEVIKIKDALEVTWDEITRE